MRVIGANRDISQHRPMEVALRESEERYRNLLQLAPDAVLVHQDSQAVYVNAAALHCFSARHLEDLIGKNVFELVHSADREMVRQRVSTVLASGRVDRGEVRLLSFNAPGFVGETITIRISWLGRPAVHVIVREVTQPQRMQEALQRSQQLLQDVVDGSANLVFVKDSERRYVLVNRAFERITGKTRNQVIGHTDHELFPRHWADY